MGIVEKEILHSVLKFAGGSLIEVVPDLLQPAAEELMAKWTDVDLGRVCKCDTLNYPHEMVDDDAVQSESFATPYDVYSFENSLGIINVLALNEEAARSYIQKVLAECGERTGSTITIDNVIKTIDVHLVIDEMGVVMNQLTQEQLDEVAISPLEDA